MNKSEQINELAAALAQFQGQIAVLEKTATVSVRMKAGGSYGYSYTPLDDILEKTRVPLAACGLSLVQSVTTAADGHPALETMLMHSSGQWLSAVAPLPRYNDVKDYGSNVTYVRRYQVTAMLRLATADDVDAPDAEGVTTTQPKAKQNGTKPEAAPDLINPATLKALHAAGKAVYGAEWDAKRPGIVAYAVKKLRGVEGVTSSKEMTMAEAKFAIDGINAKADGGA